MVTLYTGVYKNYTTVGYNVMLRSLKSRITENKPTAAVRGFSLLEVLIATAVLSIGILGIISVFYFSIRSEQTAQRRTDAIFWAREVLDTIRTRNLAFQANPWPPPIGSSINDGNYDDPTDDASVKKPLDAVPFGNDFPDNTNFTRHIEIKRVSNNSNDYRYNLAAIKVTIFWEENGRDHSVTVYGYQERP